MRGRDGRGDVHRLADIETALGEIGRYDRGEAAFLGSTWDQAAVIRNLEIVGEAAGKVSGKLRAENPEVEWAKLRGFASFAKHEYWRVDPVRLWPIVREVPSLLRKIAKVRNARTLRDE
jgi:uncharacterized protein with HEPN domain